MPTQTAPRPTSSSAVISPDYRSRYRSTPDHRLCPSRRAKLAIGQEAARHAQSPKAKALLAKGLPCKHMELEQFRAYLAEVLQRRLASPLKPGFTPAQLVRDVLYSELDYQREWLAEGTRSSEKATAAAIEFLTNSLDRLEAKMGLDTRAPIATRLQAWLKDRVLGRTSVPA